MAGGPYPSAQPEDVLTTTAICHVIQGEGERSVVEFLEWLLGSRPVENVSGLVSRRDGGIVYSALPRWIDDLD